MIIGISGKKQSGKDAVANIITNLIADSVNNIRRRNTFVNKPSYPKDCNGWEKKQFAGKLKVIASMLTGCSKNDFEDIDFKNELLPNEWLLPKGSGIYKQIGLPFSLLSTITNRQLLQYLGTDLFRNKFHPNTWVNALMVDYIKGYINNPFYDNKDIYDVSEKDEAENPPMYPNWIITDVRFLNEAEAIRDKKGIIIRINTNWKYLPTGRLSTFGTSGIDKHESETALDDYDKFNYIIYNNETKDHLIDKVKEVLIKEKII